MDATRLLIAVLVVLAFVPRGQAEESFRSSQAKPRNTDEAIEELRHRLAELEAEVRGEKNAEVDLSDETVSYGDVAREDQVLARPWYENITIWGYGAFDFLLTGDAGGRPDGDFLVRETGIFLDAQVWEDIWFHAEIRTDYKGFGNRDLSSSEVYGEFRNVLKFWKDDVLSVKAGRIDIPFSEEYLFERPPDNPLVTNSAHWLYNTDEGVLLYGSVAQINWILAVMTGSGSRNSDDDGDKAVNLRVYGNPSEHVYLAASIMRNGRTEKSALFMSGAPFRPVGSGGASSVGDSPSDKIDLYLYALDGRATFGSQGYLSLSFGQAWVDDKNSFFDRQLLWFTAEALYRFMPTFYAVVRYSEVGTYKSSEGYLFEGTITAKGGSAFGYDAKRLQRLALGVGWQPVPVVLWKLEVGGDRYEVIDVSPFDPDNDQRWFVGSELVLSF